LMFGLSSHTMKARKLGLFLVIAGIAPMAHAVLEFSGYLSSNGDIRFIVTDVNNRRTSGWLKIGDTFERHRIAGFDPQDEVLVVEHAGTPLRLPLKGARVKDAREIIALRYDADRAQFLSYVRSRGISLRDYRREVEATVLKAGTSAREPKEPNQPPDPTPGSVTPRAK
jgi:hypothetical protein